MKDRKGNEIAVGDRVFVLPEHDDDGDCSGVGFVRKIQKYPTGRHEERAQIDDGAVDMKDIVSDSRWTWSAWVKRKFIEKV